jgi:hypothetical protein
MMLPVEEGGCQENGEHNAELELSFIDRVFLSLLPPSLHVV